MRALQRYEQNQEPADEEHDLREQRRQLVEQYGGLVKKVARGIMRRLPQHQCGIEEGDLYSTGILGLFEAATRFDETVGYPFGTFAEFRIKGAMLDELRRRDFFPRRLRQKANTLNRTERELTKELGRQPSDEETAQAMDLTVPELLKLRDEITPYHYLDVNDSSLSLQSGTPSPFAAAAYSETKERLVEALQQLPEREQLVLDLYFNQDLTLREIGEILNLTVGRISQIKLAAVTRLRDIMQEG